MQNENIIASISKRGQGEIYLGVVGAVRTGKSTFIKNFIEKLVVPNITDEFSKKKCLDEVPQSAQGKTIMTTEPKFVPSSGVEIKVDEFTTNIKLVDCVGYVIDGVSGFLDENGNPRMVKSPWYEDYIPLSEAAEIGTQKVIKDHATIAIVITTDGSITDIEREAYSAGEKRAIEELKKVGKPYIVLLNCIDPDKKEVQELANKLSLDYDSKVIPISAENMTQKDIMEILKSALYEFPVENINVSIPNWVNILDNNHEIKKHYLEKVKKCMCSINKLKDVENMSRAFDDSDIISNCYISSFDSGTGDVTINLDSSDDLFNNILKENIPNNQLTKSSILEMLLSKNDNKNDDKELKSAIRMARNVGYSILYPGLDDMILESPEIIKQGNRYGVKLRAKASSLHLVKVDVESVFEPIIGSEAQSQELINYIMKDYEKDKNSIWSSEIFGRSLENIVKDGINAKLLNMSDATKVKLNTTMTKIVNKGANNLIAFVI